MVNDRGVGIEGGGTNWKQCSLSRKDLSFTDEDATGMNLIGLFGEMGGGGEGSSQRVSHVWVQ